jgi:allophanate hydrolase
MPSADPLDQGLDLATLSRRYQANEITPVEVARAVSARIAGQGAEGVWISLTSEADLLAAAHAVAARRRAGEDLPLYGIPFGVKDNIDAAGLPTTAACPAFSYVPDRHATSVQRLCAAGALVVGKTNLDQFATGLVGVRSPYGVPRNPFDRERITGGSSSGSAVAVALGQVSFTLGTDTAGSGRVPAAFNNIVGLKPSRGVISAAGVVPACRSLDCVSVFAATCEDAAFVAEVMRGFDGADPFSRLDADAVHFAPAPLPGSFRVGVPAPSARKFLDDARASRAFDGAIEHCAALGATIVEIDFAPFLAAGALLYEGPFVSERLEAAGRLLSERPETLRPELRAILEGATVFTATAAFAAQTKLLFLRRRVAEILRTIDCLMVPTAPTLPRIDAVERDPLGLNGALGVYSTFVNLLDMAALAVPVGFRDDGLPSGVTLMGPWGSDARLAGLGTRLHRKTSSRVGATPLPLPPAVAPPALPDDAILVAVVGAHLSGEPLNHQLTSLGGTLARVCKTAPTYRLFALPETTPPKPGLIRVARNEGAAIEVEVWRLSPAAFGAFVAAIPSPLGVAKLELEDGAEVCGFVCEAHATVGAEDISSFGGWRAFRRTRR